MSTVTAYKPGSHSEEAEFLHKELRQAIVPMSEILENKISKNELQQIVTELLTQISLMANKSDVKSLNDLVQKQFSFNNISDVVNSLNILEEKVKQLSDRITALEAR